MLAERRPAAALREAGRLGAWSLVDQRAGPRTGTPRRLASALAPSGPGRPRTRRPDRPRPARPHRRERGPSRPGWTGSPSRRPGATRSGRRAGMPPGSSPASTACASRAAAYGILQSVPELTVAWARTLAGASRRPRPPRPTLPKLAKLAPTPAAGDRRRRRRAGRSPGAGGRRDPDGAPGGTGRRTGPKPDWCVTLADGRRRPGPRAREASLTRPGKGGG